MCTFKIMILSFIILSIVFGLVYRNVYIEDNGFGQIRKYRIKKIEYDDGTMKYYIQWKQHILWHMWRDFGWKCGEKCVYYYKTVDEAKEALKKIIAVSKPTPKKVKISYIQNDF